jgi:aryl-alcohol dehydrogenase-like predicted oxidoreductase
VRKRPLGKTGIEVSELGLGTFGLSGDGYGTVAPGEAEKVIERALALEIGLFDTADIYGRGAMEKMLGKLVPAKTAVIVTKIGTDLDCARPQKHFDVGYLRTAFERCRERLGRDKLDIVLLHNPTMLAMTKSEPFDFLKELKRLGALRAWGVSAGSTEVARAAIRREADVMEIAYNLFISEGLHLMTSDVIESGVGVLSRSVLAHGLLAGHWPEDRQFSPGDHRADRWLPTELKQRLSQVDALRPMVNGTIPSLRAAALRFVLSNEIVSSAILGPRSVTQLEELVSEAGTSPPYLRDTALAELAARLKGVGVSI